MTAFDQAWAVLKAPYVIDAETFEGNLWGHGEKEDAVYDEMYQGGKEGDPDSGFWTSNYIEALIYSLFGSDPGHSTVKRIVDGVPEPGRIPIMRGGIPQIRIAPKTDQTHHLHDDLEQGWSKEGLVGVTRASKWPETANYPDLLHHIQGREKTTEDIEGLLSEMKWLHDPYDDEHFSGEYNDSLDEEVGPFMDTSARHYSNKDRFSHIENQLRMLRGDDE